MVMAFKGKQHLPFNYGLIFLDLLFVTMSYKAVAKSLSVFYPIIHKLFILYSEYVIEL